MRVRNRFQAGTALLLATFLLTAWLPSEASGSQPIVTQFAESPRGYLGCVQSDDFGNSMIYCVVAAQDAHDGHFDVTVAALRNVVPWLVDATYAGQVPAESFTVESTGGHTVIGFDAELPDLGAVSLTISTTGPGISVSENDTCPIYPMHVEATSRSGAIHSVWRAAGSVAGTPVIEYGPTCHIAFTGPTSAMWRVAGAG